MTGTKCYGQTRPKLNLFGHVHSQHVWHQKKDAHKENHLIPTVKYGGGLLMLWSCFAASGPRDLVKTNGIMNSTKYQNILGKNLVVSARKLRLGHRWTFHQDNDLKHTSSFQLEAIFYLKMIKSVVPIVG